MKELKECPICSSENIKFLFKQKDKNIEVPGIFSVNKCTNCSGIFLNPQPSYKESEKFYPKDKYYSLDKIKTEKDSIKTRLKLKLYNAYFSKDKNIFKKMLLLPIKFICRGTIIDKKKRLLDVGCGSGQFLYEMKQLGLDVSGIEPGKFDEKGDKKYNLNIKKGDILSVKYKKDFFDIITLNHVLEHTNNPNEVLSKIKEIINKKGILIIGVPNSKSLAYRLFGKNWYQLDIPRHIINYSDYNLKLLLNKNGFKIISVRYNSRPSQFSVSLRYALNIKNKMLEKFLWIIFLPLTWLVNFMRLGDQIEVWCEKK